MQFSIAGLPGVLKLVSGRTELKLPDHLSNRTTAKLVIRYSNCTEKPEQNELRDTCVARIGNPWLNRTAWDAQVGHEPARLMVEGWVKRRLIRDFFELLAHDGSADVRRLNYWLKWEPQITDMWFVLGEDAWKNQSAAFESVRKRMGSSARKLSDSDARNNAFVMRIGPLLVIEFGVTNNACFVFATSEFGSNLNQASLSKYDLKRSNYQKKLSHVGNWEPKFDINLRELLRSVPSSKGDLKFPKVAVKTTSAAVFPNIRPQTQAPKSFPPPPTKNEFSSSALSGGPLLDSDFEFIASRCKIFGIEVIDNRIKGGAFWVMVPNRTSSKIFTDTLVRLGFSFSPNGGGFLYRSR